MPTIRGTAKIYTLRPNKGICCVMKKLVVLPVRSKMPTHRRRRRRSDDDNNKDDDDDDDSPKIPLAVAIDRLLQVAAAAAVAGAAQASGEPMDANNTTPASPDPSTAAAASPPPKKPRTSGTKRAAAARIANPESQHYDPDEKAYYNALDDATKQSVANLEITIRAINKEDVPLRFKVLLSNIDPIVKAIAIKRLRALYEMDESVGEYHKIKHWIESLCRLPIGKYVKLPIDSSSSIADIRCFVQKIQDHLDDTVYGHKAAKSQIIRLIAQWVRRPDAKGLVIGIQGAAGTGKTSLVKRGICEALGLPFAFMALGGASDGSVLDGHSFTYEGSRWGKMADILMRCGCMNPVIFFDELDKVSQSYRGDEITNILIHLTDSSQNDKFQDKYFTDVEFDLSRSLIIFSYNDEALINPILKDRMVTIKTESYKIEDKVIIANTYLLKDLLAQFNMHSRDISFPESVIKYIITNKTGDEEGVRNLRRALESVVSNVNLVMLLEPKTFGEERPIVVSQSMVDKFVRDPASTELRSRISSMYS